MVWRSDRGPAPGPGKRLVSPGCPGVGGDSRVSFGGGVRCLDASAPVRVEMRRPGRNRAESAYQVKHSFPRLTGNAPSRATSWLWLSDAAPSLRANVSPSRIEALLLARADRGRRGIRGRKLSDGTEHLIKPNDAHPPTGNRGRSRQLTVQCMGLSSLGADLF